MEALRILGLATVAAIAYGIVHDQVTVRICVEYFTIGHPRIFDTEDPTLLALGWGVLATWWAGAGLGVLLAIAARAGSRPRRTAREMVRPVLLLLAVMAVGATLAGATGAILARGGGVSLVGPVATRVPRERHVAYLTDLWAHSASYGIALIGGVLTAWRTWRSRRDDAPRASSP